MGGLSPPLSLLKGPAQRHQRLVDVGAPIQAKARTAAPAGPGPRASIQRGAYLIVTSDWPSFSRRVRPDASRIGTCAVSPADPDGGELSQSCQPLLRLVIGRRGAAALKERNSPSASATQKRPDKGAEPGARGGASYRRSRRHGARPAHGTHGYPRRAVRESSSTIYPPKHMGFGGTGWHCMSTPLGRRGSPS